MKTLGWVGIGVGASALGLGLAYVVLRKKDDSSTQPPQASQKTSGFITAAVVLDGGLSAEENAAVQNALLRETSPSDLISFANVMLPDFPLASHALASKASQLGPNVGNIFDLDNYTDFPGNAVDSLEDFATSVASRASSAVNDLASTYKAFEKGISDYFDKLALLSKVMSTFYSDPKTYLLIGQQLLSVVPGIGPVAAAALGTGIALAMGKNIDDALIEGAAAALPIGPVGQDAFKAAARFGTAVARGERIDEAALKSARGEIKSRLGDQATAAFDAGMALYHGKSLQDVGFSAAQSLLPGAIGEKGAVFPDIVSKAKELGVDPTQYVSQKAVEDLNSLGKQYLGDIKSSIDSIVKNPQYSNLTSQQLADTLGVSEPIARAALGSITIKIPDPSEIIGKTPDQILSALQNRVKITPDRQKLFEDAQNERNAKIQAEKDRVAKDWLAKITAFVIGEGKKGFGHPPQVISALLKPYADAGRMFLQQVDTALMNAQVSQGDPNSVAYEAAFSKDDMTKLLNATTSNVVLGMLTAAKVPIPAMTASQISTFIAKQTIDPALSKWLNDQQTFDMVQRAAATAKLQAKLKAQDAEKKAAQEKADSIKAASGRLLARAQWVEHYQSL